jgi:hypothetical protein
LKELIHEQFGGGIMSAINFKLYIGRATRDGAEPVGTTFDGKSLGLRSPASVVYHLQNLERSGAQVRDGRSWNTCRLTR